jgi:hypothetical protein
LISNAVKFTAVIATSTGALSSVGERQGGEGEVMVEVSIEAIFRTCPFLFFITCNKIIRLTSGSSLDSNNYGIACALCIKQGNTDGVVGERHKRV